MIYNYIYNHVFYEQDIGHMHELKNIERIYQDFYKNENLAIQVIFSSDQLYPHQLIITTTKLNHQPIVEIYTKPYDAEIYIASQNTNFLGRNSLDCQKCLILFLRIERLNCFQTIDMCMRFVLNLFSARVIPGPPGRYM
jgi:hypothetical protein